MVRVMYFLDRYCTAERFDVGMRHAMHISITYITCNVVKSFLEYPHTLE